MEIILFRVIAVWIILHIIMFFVEMYRYKHNNVSKYRFMNDNMLDITYSILSLDIIMGIVYWIFEPIN